MNVGPIGPDGLPEIRPETENLPPLDFRVQDEPPLAVPAAVVAPMPNPAHQLDLLEGQQRVAVALNPATAPELESLLRFESFEALEKIIETAESGPNTLIDIATHYGAEPLEKSIGVLAGIEVLAEKIATDIIFAEVALKLPETLGKGATLLVKRAVINRVYQEMFRMKNEGGKDRDVARLEAWLAAEEAKLQREAAHFGIEFVALVPSAIKVGMVFGHKMTPVAQIGLQGALMAVQAGVQGYELKEAVQARGEQKTWLEKLSNPKTKQEIQDTLALQKRAQQASLIAEQDAFNKVHPEVIATPRYQEEFLRWREKKGALNGQLRNSVAALAIAKQQNERKFYDFKVGASTAAFTLTCLGLVAIITLKVLAFLGIVAISASCFAYISIGLFALGTALMVGGLLFLFIHKPHLLKSYFTLVQGRLLLYSIPHTVAEFRKERKMLELYTSKQALEQTRAQFHELHRLRQEAAFDPDRLPSNLQPLARELEKRAKRKLSEIHQDELQQLQKDLEQKHNEALSSLAADYEKLNDRAKAWQAKMAPLEEQLISGNWRDFSPTLRQNIDIETIAFGIAEGLYKNPEGLEPKTREALFIQLGLDVSKLTKIENRATLNKEVRSALQNFFKMDEKALTQFIREQKAKLVQLERGVDIT